MKKNLLKSLVIAGVMMMFPMSAMAAEGDVEINADNFPDEVFRAFVSKNCDTDESGWLSQDELDAVTSIYAWSGENPAIIGVSDLKGIEYFENLEELRIWESEIVTLDLTSLTNLKVLGFMEDVKIDTVYLPIVSEMRTHTMVGQFSVENIYYYVSDTGYDWAESESEGTWSDNWIAVSDDDALAYLWVDLDDAVSDEDVEINAINFQDEIFRTYVSENIDTNKNGYLSQAELDAVTEIAFWDGEEIDNFDGVEYFTNLESVNISYSTVNMLDLTGNANLTTVYFNGATIGELNISNTKVESLSWGMYGSTISNIVVVDNMSLTVVGKNLLDASETCLLYSFYGEDEEFELPSSVTTICEGAFQCYATPTEIVIPDTVIEIETRAFISTQNLEKVTFGTGITEIPSFFLFLCESIKQVYFVSDAPEIDDDFYFYPSYMDDSGSTYTFYTLDVYYPENATGWNEIVSRFSNGEYKDVVSWISYVVIDEEDVVTDEDYTFSDSSSNEDANLEREEVFTDGVLEYEIGAIAGVSKLTVSSDDVTLVFDEDALASITAAILAANEANEDYWLYEFSISAVEVDITTLTEDVQALVGTRPVFDFSVIATDNYGNSLEITDFGDGSVTVTVPYTLADDETADNLVIYYILNGEIAEVSAIDSYDAENELLTFTVTHFSTYAVGYEETVADTDDTDTDTDTDDTDIDDTDTDIDDTDDEDAETSPETGDTSNVALFTILVMISGCGAVVLGRRRRLI